MARKDKLSPVAGTTGADPCESGEARASQTAQEVKRTTLKVVLRSISDLLPDTRSQLLRLEKVLSSGLVKTFEPMDNITSIDEALLAARKLAERKHKRTAMSRFMWDLIKLNAYTVKFTRDDKKYRVIDWHVDVAGNIVYFTIKPYWRHIAQGFRC